MMVEQSVNTFLHPGDVVCAYRGDRLETLLGSCVSIILTDPHRTVGAMCHIVHAHSANSKARLTTSHASTALSTMYELLKAEGFAPQLCKAYVYGGGNMFPTLSHQRPVGEANISWVLNALQRDRVGLIHHDVGGHTYRRVAWTVGAQAPQVKSVKVG